MGASKLAATTPQTAQYSSFDVIALPDNQVADDPNFRVTVIKDNAEINVHISLNANEGITGVLNIYNPSGTLISKFDVELKQFPYFFNSTSNLLISVPEGL